MPVILITLYLFILGLCVGSFLSVFIYRWNTDGSPSPFFGRSFCESCKKVIVWQDLIPVFSFIRLHGRCRYCHAPIKKRYPLTEVLTACAFAIVGPQPLVLILISTLIIVFFSDWFYGLIPDQTVIIMALLGLALNGFSGLAAGLVCSSLFALVIVATKGQGLGWGDVKLVFSMGLVLGNIGIFVALWITFVTGGIVSLILLVLKTKKMHDTIPLGPYLVLGTLIAYFYGQKIVALFGV